MHDVNDQNSDITQTGTSGSQVGEGLMAWSIDYEEARYLVLYWESVVHFLIQTVAILFGKVCGTNLLGDTSSLSSLNVSLSQLV